MKTKNITYNVTHNDGDFSLPDRQAWLQTIITDAELITNTNNTIYAIDVSEIASELTQITANVTVTYYYYNVNEVNAQIAADCQPFSSFQSFSIDEMNDLLHNRFLNCNTIGFLTPPKVPVARDRVFYYSTVRKTNLSAVDDNCSPRYNPSPVEDRTIFYWPYEGSYNLNGARWENYYQKMDEVAHEFRDNTLTAPGEIYTLLNVSDVNTPPSRPSGSQCTSSPNQFVYHQYTFSVVKLESRPIRCGNC